MTRKKGEKPKARGEREGRISELLARYTPRVVVRFNDEYVRARKIPYDDRIKRYPERYLGSDWTSLVEQFPGITIRNLITSIAPQRIQDLTDEASRQARDMTYRPPNFLTFFAVRCPSREIAKAVAHALKDREKWPMIEGAYVEAPPVPPPMLRAIPQPGPPGRRKPREGARQGYLEASPANGGDPGGIDAKFAWQFSGGDGVGLQFVDLEWGWVLNHEDLPTGNQQNPQPIFGVNTYDKYGIDPYTNAGHGTASLGIVVAVKDNAFFDWNSIDPYTGSRPRKACTCVGITPAVAAVRVVSPWQLIADEENQHWVYSVADAIIALLNPDNPRVLYRGDVLLLEAQTQGGIVTYEDQPVEEGPWVIDGLPVEAQEAEFMAIRLASDLGIVIIEAAGNGTENLDTLLFRGWSQTPTNPTGQFSLKRYKTYRVPRPHWGTEADTPVDYNQYFQDSGAIMVGSAEMHGDSQNTPPIPPRTRRNNFGSRIDCYAWDSDIYTTGYPDDIGPPKDPSDPTGKTLMSPVESYVWFSGTSGASAIIAGAALAIQGIAQAYQKGDPLNSYRFSPSELRSILSDWMRSDPSDPRTGNTLSAHSTYPVNPASPLPSEWNADRIGVMPDLQKIITNTLGIKIKHIIKPATFTEGQKRTGPGHKTLKNTGKRLKIRKRPGPGPDPGPKHRNQRRGGP